MARGTGSALNVLYKHPGGPASGHRANVAQSNRLPTFLAGGVVSNICLGLIPELALGPAC